MGKRLLLFVALLAACTGLQVTVGDSAWPPPQVVRLAITGGARASLESLATVSRQTHSEQAACVTEFSVTPRTNGWNVSVEAIGPAENFRWSDSLFIWGKQGTHSLCPDGIPVVHSHVVRNEMWSRPSFFDEAQHLLLVDSGTAAPFALLVTVGDTAPSRVTIFGLLVRTP